MKKYLCTLAIGLSTHFAYGKKPIQHPTCNIYVQFLLEKNEGVFATPRLTQLLVNLGYHPLIHAAGAVNLINGEMSITAKIKYKKKLLDYSIAITTRIYKQQAPGILEALSGVEIHKRAFRQPNLANSAKHFLSAIRKFPRCEIVPAQ